MVIALIWSFVRVGPQFSVGIEDDAVRALAWPNPDLDGLNSYTRTSPIGPIIFKLSGFTSPGVYFIIHLLASISAVVLIALFIYKNVPIRENKVRAARISILAPVTGMLFISIGNYDPFTALGFIFAVWAWWRGSILLMLLAGLYLGFQHFEQAAFAIVIWSLAFVALRKSLAFHTQLKRPLWLLLGALVGKGILSLYFVTSGINPTEGRGAYFTDVSWPRMALIGSINHFPILLLSLFAGLWAVVLLVFYNENLRSRLLLLAGLAIATLAAFTTLAQSRVFVMVTLPIMIVFILVIFTDKKIAKNSRLLFVVEGIAWVIVPIHLYVSTTSGQSLITTTNALDFNIMFWSRAISLFG